MAETLHINDPVGRAGATDTLDYISRSDLTAMPDRLGYAAKLGAYASGMRLTDLPEVVVDRLRSFLLYNISVALGGSDSQDMVQRAISGLYNAPGASSVFVTGDKRSPADAAAINAQLMVARSQDDTLPSVGCHPGCVVIPALLALAQERKSKPEDVLAALAVGYEITARIGAPIYSTTDARGFRGTSLYCVLGASAACARVIGLDATQTACALAFAANMAGGLLQCMDEGTPEPRLQVAEASRAGVISALLAEQGVAAAMETFEGSKGFFRAYADSVPELSFDGWTLLDIVFKPYPGCILHQISVATVLELMERENIGSADVTRVVVSMYPPHARYPGVDQYGPFVSEVGAAMSAPFMIQTAIETGSVRLHDVAHRFGRDDVHERSRIVEVREDHEVLPYACHIELFCGDGRKFSETSEGVSTLVFDWNRTVEVCRSIARDWPVDDPDPAFNILLREVERYGKATSDGAGNIFSALSL